MIILCLLLHSHRNVYLVQMTLLYLPFLQANVSRNLSISLWGRTTQKVHCFLVLHMFFFNSLSNSCINMYAALDQGHVQAEDCNNFIQFWSVTTHASAQLGGSGCGRISPCYHGQNVTGRGTTHYFDEEGGACTSGVVPTSVPGSHGCRWRGWHSSAAWPWMTSSISVKYGSR
jgi:hypothetical protein